MSNKCQVLSWKCRWCIADGSSTQIDDIHCVNLIWHKLIGSCCIYTQWLSALHLNDWLAFTRAFRSMFSEFLWNPPPSPAPPVQICYGPLATCAAAVCLNHSQHCIGVCIAVESSCTCFAAAATIIYNNINNQNTLTKYINIVTSNPCYNLPRAVMIEMLFIWSFYSSKNP